MSDSNSTEKRAELSLGISAESIYQLVERQIRRRHTSGGTVIDVGCGRGQIRPRLEPLFSRYIGVDVIRHEGLPDVCEFVLADLDGGRIPMDDATGDVVLAIEVIEHLENPRAFVRELVRLTKPGGWLIVTTPNQLSWLSKLTLLVKNQFNAFQDGSYPAHITALLESDLLRIAKEQGLENASIAYTDSGRIPGGAWRWPGLRGRRFSDNLAMIAQKPTNSR